MKRISQIIWEHIKQQPYGTESFIDIKQITVPKYMFKTEPNDHKVKKYFKRYFRNQYLDVPITVKSKYYNGEYHTILKDGYIRFLIAYNVLQTYMDTYNVKFEEVPWQLRAVPVKWVKG